MLEYIFGWNSIDPNTIPSEPCMFVVSHSSYWDLFVVWLFSYIPEFKNLYSITKPQLQEWWYWPLRAQMNFIYAPRLEDRGTGSIEKLLAQFQAIRATPKYILLSPKGTIQNRPWRSGYYYLAKAAGLKIYPLIINYSTRTITVGEPVDPVTISLEDATKNLQTQLGKARVLNLENAEYEITDCSGCPYECLFSFDLCCLSLLSFIPYIVGLIMGGYTLQLALTVACVTVAWKYHLDYEGTRSADPRTYQRIEANLAIVTMVNHTGYYLYMYRRLPSIFVLCFFIGIFFYLNSIPRGFGHQRGKYVVFHSFYHILTAIAAFSLL